MFVWQKKIKCIDIPAQRVLLLHRSLCDVQLALPGLPSQQAGAYLCAFSVEKGIHVVVAFHLIESHQLAFYFYDKGEIRQQDGDRVLGEGIEFIESMGFMLGDLDFAQLDSAERVTLWDSLPLRKGVAAPSIAAAATEKTGTPPKFDNATAKSRQTESPVVTAPNQPMEEKTVPSHAATGSAQSRPAAVGRRVAVASSSPPPLPAKTSVSPSPRPVPINADPERSAQPQAIRENKRAFIEKLGRLLASC